MSCELRPGYQGKRSDQASAHGRLTLIHGCWNSGIVAVYQMVSYRYQVKSLVNGRHLQKIGTAVTQDFGTFLMSAIIYKERRN